MIKTTGHATKNEAEKAALDLAIQAINEYHASRGEVWTGKDDQDPDGRWVKVQ